MERAEVFIHDEFAAPMNALELCVEMAWIDPGSMERVHRPPATSAKPPPSAKSALPGPAPGCPPSAHLPAHPPKMVKNFNPADAHRKQQRQKELKKNKEDRKKTREIAVVKKDTAGPSGDWLRRRAACTCCMR